MNSKIFKMKIISVITLLLILNFFYMPLKADNEDVRPDITSIKTVLKQYKGTQRVKLHVDLACLYVKNENWKEFYSHMRSIFRDCPELMTTKINFSVPKNRDKQKVIISPKVVEKLSTLNLSHINTQDKALAYLELLKPLCEKICQN